MEKNLQKIRFDRVSIPDWITGKLYGSMSIMANHRYVLLISLFLLFGCSTVQKEEQPLPISKIELSPIELMTVYKEAMDLFFLSTSDEKRSAKIFEPYLELYRKMGWAVVQPNSEIVTLDDSHSVAFFAIYHPEHAALKQWFPTFRTMDLNGIPIVTIRPDKISTSWSPLFLVHEMSHILARLNNTDTDIIADELLAYTMEKLALNTFTSFKADAELDVILKNLDIKNELQLIGIKPEKMVPVLSEMDRKLFTYAHIDSDSEAEMRLGLYHIALGIRFLEKQSLSQHVQNRRSKDFLAKFLNAHSKSQPGL